MTLSLANATTKRASYELPPISRVQEIGGSSFAGVDIDGSYLRKACSSDSCGSLVLLDSLAIAGPETILAARCGSAAAVGLRRGNPRDERVGPLNRLADVLDDRHAFGERLVLLIPPLASLDRRRPGLPLPVGEEPLARTLRRSEVYVAVREHDL